MEEIKSEIFIIGDVNARVDRKELWAQNVIGGTQNVNGKYGENIRNNNGKRLIDFCQTHDFVVTNTFFKHKGAHKFTREKPNRLSSSRKI